MVEYIAVEFSFELPNLLDKFVSIHEGCRIGWHFPKHAKKMNTVAHCNIEHLLDIHRKKRVDRLSLLCHNTTLASCLDKVLTLSLDHRGFLHPRSDLPRLLAFFPLAHIG